MANPAVHPEASLPALAFALPTPQAKFPISKDAIWPSIVFQLGEEVGEGQELTWDWTISWLNFSQSGVVTTTGNSWDAQTVVEDLGGTLTVRVTNASGSTAAMSVLLVGTQPDTSDVADYLSATPQGSGFIKILIHETNCKHFDGNGYPKKSFDNGYGIAQLTRPAPTFAQAWNWKLNIDAALVLYGQKLATAKAYLSQASRSYTDAQLEREAVSRWNGGAYHSYNQQAGWVRNPNILCDSQTGNIGWDLTNSDNKGKTEAQLHSRDESAYRHAPAADAAWGYFGVCYADRVLGS